MEKSQAAPCRPATTSSARERRIPGRGAGGVAVCTFAVLCGGARAMEIGVICHATDALLTTVFELLSAETKNVYLREFWANVQSNASTDRHLGTCARFCSALYDRVVRMGEVRQCVRVIGVLESARAGDSDAITLYVCLDAPTRAQANILRRHSDALLWLTVHSSGGSMVMGLCSHCNGEAITFSLSHEGYRQHPSGDGCSRRGSIARGRLEPTASQRNVGVEMVFHCTRLTNNAIQEHLKAKSFADLSLDTFP